MVLIPPGVARFNHCEINAAAIVKDVPYNPAIVVLVLDDYLNLFICNNLGQMSRRCLALGLVTLGRIDTVKAYLVLFHVIVNVGPLNTTQGIRLNLS